MATCRRGARLGLLLHRREEGVRQELQTKDDPVGALSRAERNCEKMGDLARSSNGILTAETLCLVLE